ncbi:proline-rich antigen-like [Schistocerca gregaria]|uniref:proline-rich antigen-like n=1 Tax=Schistocerca gregaria TaxID=7010 RepID=UPI00211EFD96|nr:proline-rich antigen-like [Schistocerca gregaria]
MIPAVKVALLVVALVLWAAAASHAASAPAAPAAPRGRYPEGGSYGPSACPAWCYDGSSQPPGYYPPPPPGRYPPYPGAAYPQSGYNPFSAKKKDNTG